MTLQRRNQLGEKRHQALGADPVGRQPRASQRLLDLDAIVGCSWTSDRSGWVDRAEQRTNRVLAVIAGDSDELIQDH